MAAEPKTAIVTGGASGIGLAIVEHFASQGHNVAVLDLNIDSGNQLISRLAAEVPRAKFVFKKCDVSSWKSQADAFKEVHSEFGKIDIVVANAGISEQGASSLSQMENNEPQEPNLKIIDINLAGVIYSVKLATHYMAKNAPTGGPSRGSIICTASMAGLYPFPAAPLYGAAKAGVIGLVRSTARVFGQHQVQINGLAPSVLETNIVNSKELFNNMTITPMSTMIKGVEMFLEDPSLTGEIAEIHGQDATLRSPPEFVSEDSRKNIETFWELGYS